MTNQEWEIIEPRLDRLCDELDKVLNGARVKVSPVDKVLNALDRYGNLTWAALMQYTKLRADKLADAIGVLMLDNKKIGIRTDGAVRFYYLKRAA